MFKDPSPLEMFRRALQEEDLQARQWIQHSYHKVVLDWLRKHPCREEAARFSAENDYVSQTFARLWQLADGNSRLECRTLAAALQRLRACLNSVLLDTLRASSHTEARPGKDSNDWSKLWETLQGLLPGAREQRLAYLLYHCGLQPVEIVRVCPQEFSDVQEVSRLRRNILQCLARHADVMGHWIGNEQLPV